MMVINFLEFGWFAADKEAADRVEAVKAELAPEIQSTAKTVTEYRISVFSHCFIRLWNSLPRI